MNLLEILTSLQSTSSGTGCSHYSYRCGRKRLLDEQHKEDKESSFKAQTGVVFHKLAELYYSGKLKDTVLPIDDNPRDDDAVQEALRLFAGYTKYFPADEFEVLSTEQLFPRPEAIWHGDEGTYHNTDEALMADLVISPFSMRLDLLIRIHPKHVEGFRERRGLDVLPGKYILDFKTLGQKDSEAVLKYNYGDQGIVYPACYNAIFPDDPVEGMFFAQAIRHSDLHKREPNGLLRSFPTYFVPLAPLTGPKRSVQVTREQFKRQAVELAKGEPNTTACFDFGVCQYLKNGLCDRLKG
jgi:hypothetical protein